jgi:hypothetical protein
MNTLTHTRRQWLVTAAALILSAGAAQAAPPVVEIVAFAHPPVQSALKPLRDWLAKQGGKLKVVETDGSTVEFVSFPAGPGTMPGIKSAWSSADVENVLKMRTQ